MMIDIDHFKRFNDTMGYEAGDLVLRALGQLLQSPVRRGDSACRFGAQSSFSLYRRRRWRPLGRAEVLRLAVQHVLVQYHDQALYRAKREGRDRVVVAGSHLSDG